MFSAQLPVRLTGKYHIRCDHSLFAIRLEPNGGATKAQPPREKTQTALPFDMQPQTGE